MNQLEKLYKWIDQGKLFDYRKGVVPGLVDLTKAVAKLCGAPVELNEKSRELAALITGDTGQVGQLQGMSIIFVLVDGLGLIQLKEAVRRLKAKKGPDHEDCLNVEWLLSKVKTGIQTVFPSETTAALTSISTSSWPGEHGMLSWWMHLEEHDMIVESLPWCERFTRSNLSEMGIHPSALFSRGAVCSQYTRKSLFLLPREYIDSPFSRYCRNEPVPVGKSAARHDDEHFVCDDSSQSATLKSSGVGYGAYDDAVASIVRAVSDESYVYWYIPHHDCLCHGKGVYADATLNKIAEIARHLKELSGKVSGSARVIVTGDHGHVNLPAANAAFVKDGDAITSLLKVPPFGGPSGPMFSVKDGCHEQFEEKFLERFQKKAALLSKKEVVASKLLGTEMPSDAAMKKLGDYVAVFSAPGAIFYIRNNERRIVPLKGVHGGLTEQEMVVPLIIF